MKPLLLLLALIPGLARGAVAEPLAGPRWDLEVLGKAPAVYPAEAITAPGVKSLFYEGPPYQGKPTRLFAFYGVPALKVGQKAPAMVLVHGGGGTAFDRWVRLWNERGYAAIAMDLCGCLPVGSYGKWQRHEAGGPPGWGGFDQIDQPAEDQWTYHAIAGAILAHSLIRTYPEVDAERIGVTGISWGGYLTCILSGVDHRFRFAVPVYGCGFLGDNSAWLARFEQMGPEKAARWLGWWDPSVYLKSLSQDRRGLAHFAESAEQNVPVPFSASGFGIGGKHARMPMLWVTGTNDFAYPMDSLQKSYRLPAGPRTLCLRVRMPHGHGAAGENPAEIHAFADSILKSGEPLARVTAQGRDGERVWAEFEAKSPIQRAELNYTCDTGKWQDRKWETAAAELDPAHPKVTARLPAAAKVYYLNLIDARDLVVSTEHEEIAEP